MILPASAGQSFSQKHVVRDRRSAVQKLCTVCGAKLRGGVQYIDLSGWADPDGKWFNLTNTPFHPECAEAAIRHCPYVAAALKLFAPYDGPTQVGIYGLNSASVKKDFGVSIQEGSIVIANVTVQIPMSEFERLNARSVQMFGDKRGPGALTIHQ